MSAVTDEEVLAAAKAIVLRDWEGDPDVDATQTAREYYLDDARAALEAAAAVRPQPDALLERAEKAEALAQWSDARMKEGFEQYSELKTQVSDLARRLDEARDVVREYPVMPSLDHLSGSNKCWGVSMPEAWHKRVAAVLAPETGKETS